MAKEHKHIHAGQLRRTKRYCSMDDHERERIAAQRQRFISVKKPRTK
jgi:hypothetical protein